MAVKVQKKNGHLIAEIAGRLEVHLSAEVEKELTDLIQKEPNGDLILNLSNVEYISSSGLRIFVAIMRQLKDQNRKLKLCCASEPVKKVFEVTELMDLFDMYETEEDAIKAE